MLAGAMVAFSGLCIVLVKVFGVPEYGVLLAVGIGLIALGLVRRFKFAWRSRGSACRNTHKSASVRPAVFIIPCCVPVGRLRLP